MQDAAEIFTRYASDPEVTKFLGWPRHRSVADTEAFLQFSAEAWAQWPAGPYLIASRGDGQVLGSTGFGFQTAHEAMTGYVLARDAWGRGLATEALSAVVGVAAQLRLTRLFAFCHPEHRASQRVLEKCGFRRDTAGNTAIEFPNLTPGKRCEALCYART